MNTATMNNMPTHKIVVGIALAAVFAIGLSFFVREVHESKDAVKNVPTAAQEQAAAESAAPSSSTAAQLPTDQVSMPPSALPAVPPTVPPVVAAAPIESTSNNVVKGSANLPASDEPGQAASKATTKSAERPAAKVRTGNDTAALRIAAAPTANPGITSSAAPSAPLDTQPAPANTVAPASTVPQAATTPALPATSSELAASDSQITTAVKSEMATIAPNVNVGVTTTDGVVALVGTVPSQDAADQARQATLRVAGVKHVDVSALKVSDQ
jgi:hyperosmotically inducible protein